MKGLCYALRSDRFFRQSDRLVGNGRFGLFNNRAVGRKKNPSDRWFVIEPPDQGFDTYEVSCWSNDTTAVGFVWEETDEGFG